MSNDVRCLHLTQAFDDGAKVLEAAERHGLEGIVSKRTDFGLSLGAIPRLGEDQDGGVENGEPGSVERVPAEPIRGSYLAAVACRSIVI